jgi:catechol 2,3-dioxygenase
MTATPRIRFSHVGFHVHDIDAMVDFYTRLLGLEVTDRGKLAIPGNPEIAFLSSDPTEHHQIALVAGRQDGGIERGVINQISFNVEGLEDLRRVKAAAEELGVTRFLPLSHGNAWSLYFPDPEGNGIEVFCRSPWHVRQPVTDGFDLSQDDETIARETERRYAGTPDFQPAESWRAAFSERLERRYRD